MPKLKSTRRGVLGLFAGAPAAATSVFPKTTAGLHVGHESMSMGGPEISGDLLPKFNAIDPFMEYVGRIAKKRTRHVGMLDPDIASMHSWSLGAKMAKQRKRNYESFMREAEEDFWRKLKLQGFVKWWKEH